MSGEQLGLDLGAAVETPSPAGRSRPPSTMQTGPMPCGTCGEVPNDRTLYADKVDGQVRFRCRHCGGRR